MIHPRRPGNQSGQAMVETTIILAVMLLLILGAIQFALIYRAKVTLNYATFEATRAGALNYGSRRAVEFALARGLAPIYTAIRPGESMLDKVDKVKDARDKVMEEIDGAAGGDYVCIQRLNPTDEAFTAHGITDPTGTFSGPIIPNDNLIYRSTETSGSQVSIQDANLLKIKVTYCHRMIVPFISQLVKNLMLGAADPEDVPPDWTTPALSNFKRSCFADNRFPIEAISIVRMQTPAFNDSYRNDCG